jgi:hypothetical protein
LNSRKYEIVQKEEKKFLNVKTVTESSVSDLCETRSSNLLLLNKSFVETIEIEKKEEKKKSSFCFESFAIDFVLNCFHVREIESLQCVVSIIEESQNLQKENSRKKKKKRMSFEAFNQYRKSRSISNENDANLTQKVLEEREMSKSTFREREAASVTKKIVQFRSSTTISSLQALQMLFR